MDLNIENLFTGFVFLGLFLRFGQKRFEAREHFT